MRKHLIVLILAAAWVLAVGWGLNAILGEPTPHVHSPSDQDYSFHIIKGRKSGRPIEGVVYIKYVTRFHGDPHKEARLMGPDHKHMSRLVITFPQQYDPLAIQMWHPFSKDVNLFTTAIDDHVTNVEYEILTYDYGWEDDNSVSAEHGRIAEGYFSWQILDKDRFELKFQRRQVAVEWDNRVGGIVETKAHPDRTDDLTLILKR